MIVYRHARTADAAPSAPPWLDGAPAVVYAETANHRRCGIGPAHQIAERPDWQWVDVNDGWQAYRILPDAPVEIQRRINWARTRLVADAEGRQWQVPVVLSAAGTPAIIAAMGDNWLPAYTPQQTRLLAVAEAAKAALDARHVIAPDLAACCQWAAEAIEAANHITVLAIQRTRCMDQYLAVNVLLALTGALDAAEAATDGDHG